MKNNVGLVFALTLSLFSGVAWGQIEQKIVIEPENPDSNDLITISITNSACNEGSFVDLDGQSLQIRLYFFDWDCQELEPNFETTIGPLDVGDYSVTYFQMLTISTPRLADELNFSVTEALPSNSLSDGGINGLYYNPEADGHYLYVLETDFTTLVVWTTFDRDGNQAWVFGTGELKNGRSVVTDAYINRNEGVSETGEITGSEAEHWGRIEVNMTSCLEGSVAFNSDLPGFGSGEFYIERLAYVKQLDCAEID